MLLNFKVVKFSKDQKRFGLVIWLSHFSIFRKQRLAVFIKVS